MARSKRTSTGGRGKASSMKDVALQVMVPASVKRAVNVMAAREGTTQRTIVLRALRGVGIPVSEDDLHDRRKDR